jgi:hypothetical protein
MEADFQSLANLGNSKKRMEKLATGKWGLGFNAVRSDVTVGDC